MKEIIEKNARVQCEVQRQINVALIGQIALLQHQINILTGASDGVVEEIRGNRTQWRKPIWQDRG